MIKGYPLAQDQARAGAIRLLDGVLIDQKLITELLNDGVLENLAPEDRARAQRLALDTLRWLERADRVLAKHLRKPPPVPVHNILRLATVELCHGGAAHGVVNEAVNLIAKHKRHGPLKGMVNAVLRKVAEKGSEEWQKLRVPHLPKWIRKPLVAAWGAETMGRIEVAHSKGAPLDLTLKAPSSTVTEQLDAQQLPSGSLRLQSPGQVTALPGFSDGAWWVQDAAAALPVKALAPQQGEQILDLCAAPGGKTMQMAASGAVVTAVDVSEGRMQRVRQNLERTGLKATCQIDDALNLTGTWDAILLDAPCSATGTIRRHPDLPFAKTGEEFGALIELQATMIDHAWSLLKPGGRMVFCTCSLLPDEGEAQVEEALQRHSDMKADATAFDGIGVDPEWIDDLNGLRLRPDFWPDQGGMDGFYIAMLRKDG
ncbi:MAG: transcription antitermination factor NusB [Paracoccaceae bacterium]